LPRLAKSGRRLAEAKGLDDPMTSPEHCRIAYLVSKYPDVSHTFILREVFALRERGLEIETASINQCPPENKLTQQEREEAARTFYVKPKGIAGVAAAMLWMLLHHPAGLFRAFWFALCLGHGDLLRTARNIFYFAEALILAKWMHERSLKHLHVHFATPAASVALILSKAIPISTSITVHGPDEFYDVTAYSLLEKIEAARFVVCISFFAQSQSMKLVPGGYWQKFEIARLGVDTQHFQPRPLPDQTSPFTILCVGRLVSTKGQRILIEAASQLHQAGRNLRVQFVGDGPDRVDLERLVSVKSLASMVEFAGSVNQDHIQSYYKNADVFALASFAEGIPVVLMEAMAMEIPCVATRINGIPELIEDGVNGLLVAPSDVSGLAAALEKLMDSQELRRKLGSAGRIRVQQAYELSESADRLAEVFQRRLGQPS
jgi:colanic acid/amylovoran biosynthesis glycosyltransferase